MFIRLFIMLQCDVMCEKMLWIRLVLFFLVMVWKLKWVFLCGFWVILFVYFVICVQIDWICVVYYVMNGKEMLELFEVEIVCCGFVFYLEGWVIMWVEVCCLDLCWLLLFDLVQVVMGVWVMGLWWWLKYILMDLENCGSIFLYLGMLGCMVIEGVVMGEFLCDFVILFCYDYVVFWIDQVMQIIFNDVW